MPATISLSNRSTDLLNQLQANSTNAALIPLVSNLTIAQQQLIVWLRQDFSGNEQALFLIESLRTSLLTDLNQSFILHPSTPTEEGDYFYNRFRHLHFLLLTIAGTIVAVCDGFAGIVSVLGLFPSLSTEVIFAAGFAFAALSAVIFYGFDLVTISNNLGETIYHDPQLIDVLFEQVNQLKLLQKNIDMSLLKFDARDDLQALQELATMLTLRYKNITHIAQPFSAKLNSFYLDLAKTITIFLTAILFFGGGFFSGQSLAFAIAWLFIASATVTWWPVVLASVGVGLAALNVYWYVERPGLEHLVSSWFGLDQVKIDALVNTAVIKPQQEEFLTLEEKIKQKIDLLQQNNNPPASLASIAPKQVNNATSSQRFAQHSFWHRRVQSVDGLDTINASKNEFCF